MLNRPSQHVPPQPTVGYRPPKAEDAYHLPDAANFSIPADIRDQFQQDDHGRVLFFTVPPADTADDSKPKLVHTPGYLAGRAKRIREQVEAKKRRAEEDARAEKQLFKRIKEDPDAVAKDIERQAFDHINQSLLNSTITLLKKIHGDDWERALDIHTKLVADAQIHNKKQSEESRNEKEEVLVRRKREAQIVGMTNMMDYKPPNEHLEWRGR
jgi:chromatin structure-remodeling complex subunit RSC1/2